MNRFLSGLALLALGFFYSYSTEAGTCVGAQHAYGTYSTTDGAYTYARAILQGIGCDEEETPTLGSMSSTSSAGVGHTHIHYEDLPWENSASQTREVSAHASAGGSSLSASVTHSGSDWDVGSSFNSWGAFARSKIEVDTVNADDEVTIDFKLCGSITYPDGTSAGGNSYWGLSYEQNGTGYWDTQGAWSVTHNTTTPSGCTFSRLVIRASNYKLILHPSVSATVDGGQKLVNGVYVRTSAIQSSLSVNVVSIASHVSCESTSGELVGCDLSEEEYVASQGSSNKVGSGGGRSVYSGGYGGLNSVSGGPMYSYGSGGSSSGAPSRDFGGSIFAMKDCPAGESTDNPINFIYGFKHKTQSDYTDGALSLLRSYRSDIDWLLSAMGERWWHSFDRSLTFETISSQLYAYLVDKNGVRTVFLESSGSWSPESPEITTALANDGSGYVFTRDDDAREYYDSNGLLTRIEYRGNEAIDLEYDTSDRLETVTNAQGKTLTFSYDTNDRIDEVVTPSGTFSYAYDSNGNLITVTKPDTESVTYHYENTFFVHALTGITDETGKRVEKYAYDFEGRPVLSGLGDLSEMSSVIYGTDSTSVINALGKKTTYHFDTINDVRKITQVEGHQSSNCAAANQYYTYDKAGNMLTRTDALSEVVTYTYDAINRVTSVSYSSDSSLDQSFTYDSTSGCGYSIGQLCSVSDASGTTTYEYDLFGRLESVTETRGSLSFTTGYGYDAAGVMNEITLPSGRVITYTLNATGRPSAVHAPVNGTSTVMADSISYYPFGPVQFLHYVSGIWQTNYYDTGYKLTRKIYNYLYDKSYTYDDAGNIITKTGTTYTYDDLYRLTSENSDSYTYDAIGNRLTDSANSYTYPSTSSRLSQINSTSLTTDAAGQITQDLTRDYVFNAAGQLAHIGTGPSYTASYVYNANNQRTEKTTSAGTVHYVYGAGGLLYGEYDDTGALIREYVWLDGSQPLGQIDDNGSTETLTRLYPDHLGMPIYGTNVSGTQVWSLAADAFGNGTPSGTAEVNLRFPGQYWDAESGLHYNWNRYYDPETGRYISSDPIGLQGGLNTFAYVGANPVMFVDPEGLIRWNGTVSYIGAGVGVGDFGLGYFYARYYLVSECLNGRRVKITVSGQGWTKAAGLNFSLIDGQSVEFDDGQIKGDNPTIEGMGVDLNIFNGKFEMYVVSAHSYEAGLSVDVHTALGGAKSTSSNNLEGHISDGYGIDIGATVVDNGSSRIVGTPIFENCSCN